MTFYQIKKIVFRFMPPPLDQINGQWTIENYFFTLIYQWNLPCDGRGAALLRLITSFYNQMEINKITNEFILLFVVLSCRVGWRRSTLRLYNHVQFSILNSQLSIDEVCAKLIVNCPFSIFNCFTVLLNNEKPTLPDAA